MARETFDEDSPPTGHLPPLKELEKRPYQVHECAVLFQIASRTVRRHIDQGLLQAMKKGRGWQIPYEEIERLYAVSEVRLALQDCGKSLIEQGNEAAGTKRASQYIFLDWYGGGPGVMLHYGSAMHSTWRSDPLGPIYPNYFYGARAWHEVLPLLRQYIAVRNTLRPKLLAIRQVVDLLVGEIHALQASIAQLQPAPHGISRQPPRPKPVTSLR